MSNYKGIFSGTFTMGNMVCGFLAILSIHNGNITTACWIVVLASFLDALDGKVARLSGGASAIGIELDSLADLLSFGVAPAFLLYAVKLHALGEWGWVLAVVYLMAAAYRLARFNLLAETEEKRNFLGLPVPAAGVTLASFVILGFHLRGELMYDKVLLLLIVMLSFLMVSQVEYDAFPENFETGYNRLKLAVLVAAVAVVIIQPRLLLFPIMVAYILSGMARELYRLYYLGVGKVTGRWNRGSNGKQDRE